MHPSYTDGGTVKWHSHFGKQFDSLLKSKYHNEIANMNILFGRIVKYTVIHILLEVENSFFYSWSWERNRKRFKHIFEYESDPY